MLLLGLSMWCVIFEIIACLAIVVVTQLECYGWTSFAFIGTLVVLHFLKVFSILAFAKENAVSLLFGCLIYLAIGIVWSFVKWVSFLYKFKEARNDKSIYCYKNTSISQTPKYQDYKTDIVAWIIFWIPSLIGTLLDDFVRRFVTWIANRFSKLYQGLANKIVPEVK